MLHRAQRAAPALLEPRLQAPDLAHVGDEAALDGELARLLVEHRVHRLHQRGDRVLAGGLARLPAVGHQLPEQRREQEARRDRPAGAHARVGVAERDLDEALAVRLLEDHVEQRQQPVVQALGAQPPHAGERVARLEQLQHLVEEARRRHVLDQVGELCDRRERGLVDVEVELGREAHRAQHPHRVLAVARGRVADHPQRARLQVLDAAEPVEHLVGDRVVVERVDGEVAPQRVLLLRAEHVVAQHAAVLVGLGVGLQRAEGRGLDRLAAEHHVHDLEAPADDPRTAERGLHLLGRRVGGDVEVLGHEAEQRVAHAAADDEGLEPGALQDLAGAERGLRDLVGADAELGALVGPQLRAGGRGRAAGALRGGRRGRRGRRGVGRAAAEELADECDDHRATPSKSRSTGQPRSIAAACSTSSGLVATGSVTRSSSGRSLRESL